MSKYNTKGFTVIEGLLLLIAVTLIGFTGFYVYNANKNADQSNAERTVESAGKKSELDSSKIKAEETVDLIIQELGVQIPLPEAYKSVGYELYGENVVIFQEEEFTELVRACATSIPEDQPVIIGTLSSYEGVYDEANDETPFEDFMIQLPGTYLEYGTPDGGYCGDTTEAKRQAVQERYQQIDTVLKAAIKKATKPE